MLHIYGNEGLKYLSPDVNETLLMPVSDQGEVYVGPMRGASSTMAELIVTTLGDKRPDELAIAAKFDGDPLPLQLINTEVGSPALFGRKGFCQPLSGLDMHRDYDNAWTLQIDEGMVDSAETVDTFLCMVSLGVRKAVARREIALDREDQNRRLRNVSRRPHE